MTRKDESFIRYLAATAGAAQLGGAFFGLAGAIIGVGLGLFVAYKADQHG